jgi:phosphatidate cytidylyltransferase
MDKKNLGNRFLAALVFAAFFLSLLYFGGGTELGNLLFLALLALGLVAGIREMTLIGRKMGYHPSLAAGVLVGLGLLAHFFSWKQYGADNPVPLWLVLAGGGIVIHIGALLFDSEHLETALPSQAITWMAALYMGLGLGFQQKLFMLQGDVSRTGARLILSLYIIVWFGDTAAFFVGNFCGKRKLAPKVSPKKTWEGALGNTAGNILGAFLMKATVCPSWSPLDAVLLGFSMGLVGQLGDLAESMWKRSAGVKDSNVGVSIPGHGGVLDRVDSLVFAAPVLYAYVHFVHGLN